MDNTLWIIVAHIVNSFNLMLLNNTVNSVNTIHPFEKVIIVDNASPVQIPAFRNASIVRKAPSLQFITAYSVAMDYIDTNRYDRVVFLQHSTSLRKALPSNPTGCPVMSIFGFVNVLGDSKKRHRFFRDFDWLKSIMPQVCGISQSSTCVYWRSVYHSAASFDTKALLYIAQRYALWNHTNNGIAFPELKNANRCPYPCNVVHPMIRPHVRKLPISNFVVGMERVAGMYLALANHALGTEANHSCKFGQNKYKTSLAYKVHGRSYRNER